LCLSAERPFRMSGEQTINGACDHIYRMRFDNNTFI